jgi:cell division protein FtsW
MIDKLFNHKFKGDGIIWMVFFLLCIISIVEVYSASSSLSYKSGNYWSPVMKHSGLLMVGFVCMIVVLNIKCKYFKIVTPFMLLAAFFTLIWVLAAGHSTNGAQRWISLVGIQFQPSEIAKGAMVLATAQILSAMQTEHGADRRAFKYIMIVSAFIVPLIMLENLSTAVLLCAVIVMMMFIGRVPISQIGKLLGIVMLCVVFALSMILLVGKEDKGENSKLSMTEKTEAVEIEKPGKLEKMFHRADTWKARIMKFMDDEEVSPAEFDLDKDAQVAHANIAIASSNVVGKGPGNSVERDFLSQAFSDFIYAIIIEEMGIVGALVVCLLYIILLFRTASIANRCVNAFPALLIMGLALLLVTQAFFNMLVAVGLVPVTGQPLPLISKGGTSTIINCIYIGAILSVSYTAKKNDEEPKTKKSKRQLAIATSQA